MVTQKFNLTKNKYFNQIIYLDNVSSTQEYLKKMAQNNTRGLVCVAYHQTNGRGRMGRAWLDDEANLKFSMLFDATICPCLLPLISLVAGIALKETIEKLYTIAIQIKWPNDILVDGKKICGILSESASANNSVKWIVCGIGVNLNMTKENIPTELKDVATSLFVETNQKIEEQKFLENFLVCFCNYLTMLEQSGGKVLIEKYQSLCDTIGRKIKIILEEETKIGIACKIDDIGNLVVKTEKGEEKFCSADIVHIR